MQTVASGRILAAASWYSMNNSPGMCTRYGAGEFQATELDGLACFGPSGKGQIVGCADAVTRGSAGIVQQCQNRHLVLHGRTQGKFDVDAAAIRRRLRRSARAGCCSRRPPCLRPAGQPRAGRWGGVPSLYLPAATLPLAPLKCRCVTPGNAASRCERARPTKSALTPPSP